jgi:uncharacterized protein Yka (UPF0111/DUF47 family)
MFKFNLVPQDKIFFTLFDDLSKTLKNIVEEFEKFLKDYQNKDKYLEKISSLDKQGKDISDKLRKELLSTFVTPMDREDIHSLTKLLNSIISHVNGAVVNFELYSIDKINEDLFPLSELLVRAVNELGILTSKLDNMSALEKLSPHILRLHEIEDDGDQAYRNAIRCLFKNNHDPIDVIKWKDIFNRVENAIDKCDDAGNVILGMVLKYA